MRRQAVESSVLRSVGYDRERETLEIEFQPGGRIYQYFGVPEEVYRELLAAPSLGQYFNEKIKGAYPYVRVSRR
ncbi:MAG: KTSC domain-containing protein [Sphaerobacter sp.]|nr:KTSC domain-containing protein [Sphaerobacter sp.]